MKNTVVRIARKLPGPLRSLLRRCTPPTVIRFLSEQPNREAQQQRDPSSGEDLPDAPGVTLHSPDESLPLADFFWVLEVDDAEPLVGKLFRRRFHTDSFPDEPRHFVAFARLPDGATLSLGYVHYTPWDGCALCGGLVIDERHYRRLPPPMRKALQGAGGVAEQLLRQSFLRLPDDTIAIWGHVGDRQSRKVCLRAGFEATDDQYLMAVWRAPDLTDQEKRDWVSRAAGLEPF